MEKITLIQHELDGKKLAFASNAEFYVQLGKGNSSYKTKLKFLGSEFAKAVYYYNALNVGCGYKKRLYSPNLNKPVLARQFS
jgi:hypothetical protein